MFLNIAITVIFQSAVIIPVSLYFYSKILRDNQYPELPTPKRILYSQTFFVSVFSFVALMPELVKQESVSATVMYLGFIYGFSFLIAFGVNHKVEEMYLSQKRK